WRVVAAVDDPLHVFTVDAGLVLALGHRRRRLDDIDPVPAVEGIPGDDVGGPGVHGVLELLRRLEGDFLYLMGQQGPEVHLHAAGADGGGNLLGHAGGGPHHAEVG